MRWSSAPGQRSLALHGAHHPALRSRLPPHAVNCMPGAAPSTSRTEFAPATGTATWRAHPILGSRSQIGAVCGPSQPTKRRSTTRCNADQRRIMFAGQRCFPGRDQKACLVLQKILSISTTLPSPGGQVSGMASHQKCRTCRVGGVWRPLNLPQGLPHANPGAEPHGACGGSVEGCPRAGVWPGDARSRGRHTTPVCKIVGGRVELMIVWTLYGHKTHPGNRK